MWNPETGSEPLRAAANHRPLSVLQRTGSAGHIVRLLERVAATPLPILIEDADRGCRQLLAAYVHSRSALRASPFAVVETEAGMCDRRPLAAIAGHRAGTLFVDDVAELGLDAQAALVRWLQTFGDGERARLVAGTGQDLAAAAERGMVREDLFFRLNVARVAVRASEVELRDAISAAGTR